MQTDFPAVFQKRGTEILKALNILVRLERGFHLIVIILNDHAVVPTAIFFRKLQQIWPPDIGIEIFNTDPVIPLYILTGAGRDRRGKVIQIKRTAIDYRPGKSLPQQAVTRRMDSPISLFHNAEVVKDNRSILVFPFPQNRKLPVISADNMHGTVFIQRQGQRGFVWLFHHEILSFASQQKISFHADSGKLIHLPSHLPDAQAGAD